VISRDHLELDVCSLTVLGFMKDTQWNIMCKLKGDITMKLQGGLAYSSVHLFVVCLMMPFFSN
jgi:hypothetical protein